MPAKALSLSDWNPFNIPRGTAIADATRPSDEGRPLVAGLLEANAITLLAGAPAAMKSMLAYHIGIAVAAGQPFVGRPVERRRVVYIDRENPPAIVAQRARSWPPPERFYYWPTNHAYPFHSLMPLQNLRSNYEQSQTAHLLQTDFQHWIEMEPTLLILDSFVRFHQENESDAQSMARLWEILRGFRDAGTALLILHHTRTNTNRPRGGSEMAAGPDVVMHIGRLDQRVTITEQKNRGRVERQTVLQFSADLGFTAAEPLPAQRRRRHSTNQQQPTLFEKE